MATFCADLADELVAPRRSCTLIWPGLPRSSSAVHHRADVADERRGDGLVAVHLGCGDVDLDELGVGVPLRRIAMSEQPVQPCTDEHHHVGPLQRQRAGGRRRLRVVVGQQALGHRHRHVRDAGGLDELADLLVGLGVGGTLAEHDQRPLRRRPAGRWPSRPRRFRAAAWVPGRRPSTASWPPPRRRAPRRAPRPGCRGRPRRDGRTPRCGWRGRCRGRCPRRGTPGRPPWRRAWPPASWSISS